MRFKIHELCSSIPLENKSLKHFFEKRYFGQKIVDKFEIDLVWLLNPTLKQKFEEEKSFRNKFEIEITLPPPSPVQLN